MKGKYRGVIYFVIIISISFSFNVSAEGEEKENSTNNELFEYRLNSVEEELKEKVNKEALENGVIKTLEIQREALITDRDFYQNLFSYTLSILGVIFAIISAFNIYGIWSSRKILADSKKSKEDIEKIKNEVDDLAKEVKTSNDEFTRERNNIKVMVKEVELSKNEFTIERENIKNIIEQVKSSNNEFISERDKIKVIINKVYEVNEEFNHERDQILSNLVEEKQKIQDQILSFNQAMSNIEKSFNNFNTSKDSKKFASEINEQMIALKQVAASEVDHNLAKVALGKLKDQEVDEIQIDKEEI